MSWLIGCCCCCFVSSVEAMLCGVPEAKDVMLKPLSRNFVSVFVSSCAPLELWEVQPSLGRLGRFSSINRIALLEPGKNARLIGFPAMSSGKDRIYCDCRTLT